MAAFRSVPSRIPTLKHTPRTDHEWNLLAGPSSRAIAVDGTDTSQQGSQHTQYDAARHAVCLRIDSWDAAMLPVNGVPEMQEAKCSREPSIYWDYPSFFRLFVASRSEIIWGYDAGCGYPALLL